eukprot:TRINITY_DN2213_c0_g1_i1.p1 TRINITY_DN2213_c0_g1~~TRINITY_DN2213_c0_g1_i1.p1  ORF type:complete len:1149 (+),score=344.51 TRINITY_DN2213_c0_g1_i1:65-3511(+)
MVHVACGAPPHSRVVLHIVYGCAVQLLLACIPLASLAERSDDDVVVTSARGLRASRSQFHLHASRQAGALADVTSPDDKVNQSAAAWEKQHEDAHIAEQRRKAAEWEKHHEDAHVARQAGQLHDKGKSANAVKNEHAVERADRASEKAIQKREHVYKTDSNAHAIEKENNAAGKETDEQKKEARREIEEENKAIAKEKEQLVLWKEKEKTALAKEQEKIKQNEKHVATSGGGGSMSGEGATGGGGGVQPGEGATSGGGVQPGEGASSGGGVQPGGEQQGEAAASFEAPAAADSQSSEEPEQSPESAPPGAAQAQAATGGGEAPAASGQAATGGGEARAASGQAATGGGEAPAASGQAATGGGEARAASGQAATGGGETPAASGQAPAEAPAPGAASEQEGQVGSGNGTETPEQLQKEQAEEVGEYAVLYGSQEAALGMSNFKVLGHILLWLCLCACLLNILCGSSGPVNTDDAPEQDDEPEEEVQEEDPTEADPIEEAIKNDPRMKEWRRKRTRFLMQMAIEKDKREKTMEELVALEADIRSSHQPEAYDNSEKDMKAVAAQALKGTEMLSQQSLLTVIAYTAPFFRQGAALKGVIETHAERTRNHLAATAATEADEMIKAVRDKLYVSGLENHAFLTSFDIPKATTVLAAAMAPLQLKSIYASNLLSIVLQSIFLIMDLSIVILDVKEDCWSTISEHERGYFGLKADSHVVKKTDMWFDKVAFDYVYGWFAIDMIVTLVMLVIRLRVNGTLSELLGRLEAAPKVNIVKDPIESFRTLVDHFTSKGGAALMELRNVAGSSLFAMVDVYIFFNFCWMIYAAKLTLNIPWAGCAHASLFLLRTRVIIFFILLIPWVLAMFLAVFNVVIKRSGVAIAILRVADSVDEGIGLGLPVCKVFAAVILVRSMRGDAELQVTVKTATVAQAEKIAAEAAAIAAQADQDLQEARGELASAEERLAELGATGVAKQFEEMRNTIMNDSESFLRDLEERGNKLAEETGAKEATEELSLAIQRGQLADFIKKRLEESMPEDLDKMAKQAQERAAAMASQAQQAAEQAQQEAAARAEQVAEQAQAAAEQAAQHAEVLAEQAAEAAEHAAEHAQEAAEEVAARGRAAAADAADAAAAAGVPGAADAVPGGDPGPGTPPASAG